VLVKLCAPGGKWAERDRAAFEAEFISFRRRSLCLPLAECIVTSGASHEGARMYHAMHTYPPPRVIVRLVWQVRTPLLRVVCGGRWMFRRLCLSCGLGVESNWVGEPRADEMQAMT